MGHSERLAERVRRALGARDDVVELRMMGGLAFMLRGHMCCGLDGDVLRVRVGPDGHQAALAEPHARPMDLTGRPLRGFILVDPAGVRTKAALTRWVQRGVDFAASLPPKRAGAGRARTRHELPHR